MKLTKDGRLIEVWEAPVKAYVEQAGPITEMQIRKSRRIHAISVVMAQLEGKAVNPARIQEHTEDELADAREAVWRIGHPGQWSFMSDEHRARVRAGSIISNPVYEPRSAIERAQEAR